VLHRALAAGRLEASADPAIVATAEYVVVVIGTPVDEHLNPNQMAITRALRGCSDFLRDGQLLILRSTVFPGVTALVEKMMAGLGLQIEVAFCPERIAEGKAMTELFELPQIVSSSTPAGTKRATHASGGDTDHMAGPARGYRTSRSRNGYPATSAGIVSRSDRS
jgi:UDP-N-acetyl-D-mannosaminuronic acid dehydrogenase